MPREPKIVEGATGVLFTEKQTLFINEYLANGQNATKAAKAAGYSEKGAATQGWEILQKPEVQAEIAQRKRDAVLKAGITVDDIIAEHAVAGFSVPDGKPTWADKRLALAEIAKMAGFTAEQANVNVNLTYEGFREQHAQAPIEGEAVRIDPAHAQDEKKTPDTEAGG